jgi:hypothetical protein
MSKLDNILVNNKNPRKIIKALGRKQYLNWLPDKEYLKLVFWASTGKKLNLEDPLTFNEKLQWIKLYDRKTEYIQYADKYAVQSYIKETIGEEYLIPLIAVYDHVEDIDWESLPERFVIKCTHASGANIICTDKKSLDIQDAKNKLKKWLKRSWFWFGREWPYKSIKPRMICQPYLSDSNSVPNDYKVMCFNGKAKMIQVHTGRYVDHKVDFFDLQWNRVNISSRGSITDSELVHIKPQKLEEMIRLSEIIAANTTHARIDWFVVAERLYFGEITLFETSGFLPFENEKDDILFGSWIKLPSKGTAKKI